jgi:hypothetical protein
MNKYAVAVGEMFDAINFYGPFDEFEDGMEWGEANANRTYFVIQLEEPNAQS